MFILILDSVEDFHTVEERRLHRIFGGLLLPIETWESTTANNVFRHNKLCPAASAASFGEQAGAKSYLLDQAWQFTLLNAFFILIRNP